MTAPTPGPWKIGGIHSHKRSCGPNCKQSIHGADGSTVAVVFRAASRTLNNTGTEYVDAPADSPDASLVAAAPSLYAFIRELAASGSDTAKSLLASLGLRE